MKGTDNKSRTEGFGEQTIYSEFLTLLDLDRLSLGGMPSRTRHPTVLVIQLAHSREITPSDNTLVVAPIRSLPRQSLRRPAVPPVLHGVVLLSSLSPSYSLVLVLASMLSPPRGRSHSTARTGTHARAHPSVARLASR